MNTVTLKKAQIVDTDTSVIQDRIVAALEASKKQIKKLSWLLERHPGFVEENALDEHLGLEVRRLRW